jgi:hypothetical protein
LTITRPRRRRSAFFRRDRTRSGAGSRQVRRRVDRIFGAGGPLAPAVGSFKPRQSQTEMAKSIADAIGKQKR